MLFVALCDRLWLYFIFTAKSILHMCGHDGVSVIDFIVFAVLLVVRELLDTVTYHVAALFSYFLFPFVLPFSFLRLGAGFCVCDSNGL